MVHEPGRGGEGAGQCGSGGAAPSGSFGIGRGGLDAPAVLFWAVAGVPLAWGIWKTLEGAIKIF